MWFFTESIRAEYCPNLRNDPVIDRFMYQISSRYTIALPASFFSQPMSVCDVLSFIDKADSLSAVGKLSSEEASDAQQIRKRIQSSSGIVHVKNEKYNSNLSIHCAVIDTDEVSAGNGNAQFVRGLLRPSLNANVGNVSFNSEVDVWTDWRSDTVYKRSSYQPYDGVPYNLYNRADSSSVRSSDLLRGGISYDSKVFRLEAGIDRLRQGPAVFNPLTFSGFSPPMTYVKGRLSFGFMDYVQAVGLLQSEKDKPKYFYMHRVTMPLFNSNVVAGITEVVINGSTTNQQPDTDKVNALRPAYYGETRTWELAYMIPFVPYSFAEHFLGDRDNKALSFDITIPFPRDFRLYMEFFLDDFTTPWGLFSPDWGNKWAITLGGQYFTRVFSKDLVTSLEYCRVEPWVYTHFYGGSHRYDNFNQPLGAPIGPNADMMTITMETPIWANHWIGCAFTNNRSNPSYRGGKITDVFQDPTSLNPPDSPKKVFLASNGLEIDTRLGVLWSYNPYGIFRVAGKYEYDFTGKSLWSLNGGLFF